MADESFYKRITRLFRSGPAIRRKIRGLDQQTHFDNQTAARNDLGIYNGYSYKREQSNLALLGAYGIYDRMSRYCEFNEMEYSLADTTKIAVPGGYKTIKELIQEYGSEGEFIVYSYDHNNNKIVPAIGKNVRHTVTCDAYKVTFDNGKEIIGSANHRLMKRDGTYSFISDLQPGDAMMPFYRKALLTEDRKEHEDEYLYIYTMNRSKSPSGWQSEHRLIAEWMLQRDLAENEVVHHLNFRKHDNRPENLKVMDELEHKQYHARLNNTVKWNKETNSTWIEEFKVNHSKFMHENNPAERKDITFGKILQFCQENEFRQLSVCKAFGTDPNTIKRKLRANGFDNFEVFAKAYCPAYTHCDNKGSKNPRFNNNITYQIICNKFQQNMTLNELASSLGVSHIPVMNRLKEQGFKSWSDFKEQYSNCKVVSVELYQKDMKLYDLTVEGYKNFATDSVISHNTTEISTALDLYADESASGDESGRCFHVHSDSPNIQRALEELFYEVIGIDFELRQWIRNLVKYGDAFLYVEVEPNEGVSKVEPIHVNDIDRLEGFDPNDKDAVRFKVLSQSGKFLENWQVIHYRIKGNDLFYPYGTSFLESARRVWRQLIMLEDAMLVYRVVRSPERRVYYIDVSGIHPNEVPNFMEQVKQNLRSTQAMSRSDGRLDQRHQPVGVDDDIWLPTRPNSQTKVDSLAGGQHVSAVEDVEYMQKKLTACLKIPRAYLGFDDMLSSKATLSQEDIRFSRTISNLQKIIIAELNELAVLHLYAKGFDGEELKNFELKLSNPSTVALQQKLNLWNIKFEIAGKAKESGLVDEEWIQRSILELNNNEIINIRVGREKDQLRNKTLEALSPPDPNLPPDESSITDPFDVSNYQVPGSGVNPNTKPTSTQSPPNQSVVSSKPTPTQVAVKKQTAKGQAPIKPNFTPNLDKANRRFSRQRVTGARALSMPDFMNMLDTTKDDVYDLKSLGSPYKEGVMEKELGKKGGLPTGLTNGLKSKLRRFESKYKSDNSVISFEILREDTSEDDWDENMLLDLLNEELPK